MCASVQFPGIPGETEGNAESSEKKKKKKKKEMGLERGGLRVPSFCVFSGEALTAQSSRNGRIFRGERGGASHSSYLLEKPPRGRGGGHDVPRLQESQSQLQRR